MTKFALYNEVQKNYKGYLTLEKALVLFELDNGYVPEIEEDNYTVYINDLIITKYNKDNDTDITVQDLIFMKELQNSKVCNMITESSNIIQTRLSMSRKEAKELLSLYIYHYNEIYYPELCL